MTIVRPGVAASAAVLPDRWRGPLLPLGVPSRGGVTVWHPDHVGVHGRRLADLDAAVPVDLAAGRVPLVWQRMPEGSAAPEPLELGTVETAWLDEFGVLCVGGPWHLDTDGAVSLMSTAAREAAERRPLVISPVLADPVPDDGDWNSITGWTLRGVALCPAESATWPNPLGRFFPVERGAAMYPGGLGGVSAVTGDTSS